MDEIKKQRFELLRDIQKLKDELKKKRIELKNLMPESGERLFL